ncbi:unnamed protein product, partial [Rotaria sp. Silwood1]
HAPPPVGPTCGQCIDGNKGTKYEITFP